jgi:hypothetical protein
MASVHIIRHKPIPIFCSTAEVVITYDDNQIVRLVEPSGNVGTQYSKELGAQWFGTIQNLMPGLARGGANWGDVYKTDVLWTTPSPNRDACEAYRNDYNSVYGPMLQAVTGCTLKSNRMARFTDAEGFPDPTASFEVQIKAIKGEDISFGSGKIEFGEWTDFQPSGASVQHTDASGKLVTSLGDDVKQEMEFVIVEQYEKKLAAEGVDFKTQTAWLEVLVAIDDNPSVTWQRIEAVRQVVADYFGDNRPAGKIYPVSRIPNLDGIVEPQPRCVTGDVTIDRSGDIVDGFSTWTAIRRKGVSEVLVSGVGGDNADTLLNTLDGHIKSAGGKGLKENGVFNNAYIVAGANSAESRARLTTFNEQFSGYYTGVAPSGRTAQYVPGFMQENYICGISNRAIFAG